ncbi:MAG: recombinase family protein [Chloroflexia bacterium]
MKQAMQFVFTATDADVIEEFDLQLDAIKRFAEANGYEIAFPLTEWSRSGPNVSDRDFKSHVSNCRASNYSALIAYSPDRLTTDPKQLQRLKEICVEHDVELLFVNPAESTAAAKESSEFPGTAGVSQPVINAHQQSYGLEETNESQLAMGTPIVYDKAKWHYRGDYPGDLPIEQAFVHIGIFFGWIIDHELYIKFYLDTHLKLIQLIQAFKRRQTTGAKVLEECDGALMDDMLSDEGNRFAQSYYKDHYVDDLSELFDQLDVLDTPKNGEPSLYHIKDTWENYKKIKNKIDQRYTEWKNMEQSL